MRKKVILSALSVLLLILLVQLYIPKLHSKSAFAIKSEFAKSSKLTNSAISKSNPIDRYLQKVNFNGSAAVIKNGKVIVNKGYGYRDINRHLPNNTQTVFYLASISKIFVSTSIMQLQDQKKLNINDTLNKYIPDFPKGNQIKLFYLLTQTSGLSEHSESNQKVSHQQLIKQIEKLPISFKPGTNWKYSDSNYSILAYIIEKVSHESLENYVQQHILHVAKMKDTGYGDRYDKQADRSIGYMKQNNKFVAPSRLPDMSELFGCGDVFSTPYDMYLFDNALNTGKLLSPKSLKQLLTPYKNNYALGIWHNPDSYSDHGLLPGWNVLNTIGSKKGNYVILFTNIGNGAVGSVTDQILKMENNMN